VPSSVKLPPKSRRKAPKAAAIQAAPLSTLAKRRKARELFEAEFLKPSGLTLKDAVGMKFSLVRVSDVAKDRPGLELGSEWAARCEFSDPEGNPYLDAYENGLSPDPYARVRRLGELRGFAKAKKKSPKYKNRTGAPLHLGFPTGSGIDWTAYNKDTSKTWRITEGEKKGALLSQKGLPTVVMGGIWNFAKDGKLISDFDAIAFQNRRAEIIPDNDYQTKEQVRSAVADLASQLQRRGARVYLVQLPKGPLKGADDFVVKRGIRAFKKLCASARLIQRPLTADDPTPEIPLLDTETARSTVPMPVHGTCEANTDTLVNIITPKFTGRIVTFDGAIYERGLRGICIPLMEPRQQTDAMLRVLGPLGFRLDAQAITKLFTNVVAYAERGGSLIRAVRFDDDPGDCLARIALPTKGNWDAWREFTSRLAAPAAFMAFVWSIFEYRHAGRQLCWLRGDGEDGKTVVANELLNQIRGAGCVLDDERLTGPGKRFAIASAFDKRLVVVPDTKNRNLAMVGLIHQLTGGDSMNVEGKGLPPFTARPRVRVLTHANPSPRITRSRSNTSRLMLIEVQPRAGGTDPEWPGLIHAQFPAFLEACQAIYAEVCPNHGDIALDPAAKSAIERAIDEDEFEHMASTFLVRVPGSVLTITRLYAAARSNFSEFIRDNHKWSDFKSFLQKTWGAKECWTSRKQGHKPAFKGIGIRAQGGSR